MHINDREGTVGKNNPGLVQELDSNRALGLREKEIIARSVIRVCQNISEMRENSCLVRCHED